MPNCVTAPPRFAPVFIENVLFYEFIHNYLQCASVCVCVSVCAHAHVRPQNKAFIDAASAALVGFQSRVEETEGVFFYHVLHGHKPSGSSSLFLNEDSLRSIIIIIIVTESEPSWQCEAGDDCPIHSFAPDSSLSP